MSKGARAELEELVQRVDRAHPDWPASSIEAELQQLAPVRYADWKANTPNPGARLRQVQRWRSGGSSPPKPAVSRPLIHHLWPVGERQRQEIEPDFPAGPGGPRATHRLFLHNCSDETIREIRMRIAGKEVGFEPALAAGRCVEIPWFKNPIIREATLAAPAHQALPQALVVEFALAKGTRAGRLKGQLQLDSTDGWVAFTSEDSLGHALF